MPKFSRRDFLKMGAAIPLGTSGQLQPSLNGGQLPVLTGPPATQPPPLATGVTWDPTQTVGGTLNSSQLTATSTGAAFGTRSTTSHGGGALEYWETAVVTPGPDLRIGIANANWVPGTPLGSDGNSIGFDSNGIVYGVNNSSVQSYALLTNTGSNQVYTVPYGVTQLNAAEAIGAGGGGAFSAAGNSGGGGGEYRKATNVPVTPGQQIPYQIGVGGPGSATGVGQAGTATWLGAASGSSAIVVANPGQGGATTGGLGGTGGIGAVGYPGGQGGTGGANSAGAGGAAGGPNGAGAPGGSGNGLVYGGPGGGAASGGAAGGSQQVVQSASQVLTSTSGQISDQYGNTWTLVSGSNGNEVYVNGAAAGFSAQVTTLEISSGVVYQENAGGNWYSYTPTAGSISGANVSWTGPVTAPSPPAQSQIVDQYGNVWTLQSSASNGNVIYVNNTLATTTAQVTVLELYDGVIWQENAGGFWYSTTPTGANMNGSNLSWTFQASGPAQTDGAPGGQNHAGTGAGAAGVSGTPAGGAGTAGAGGGGGEGGPGIAGAGGPGGPGNDWGSNGGPGGGGGAPGTSSSGTPTAAAGAGGLYGGGGAGGPAGGAAGAQGAILLTLNGAATSTSADSWNQATATSGVVISNSGQTIAVASANSGGGTAGYAGAFDENPHTNGYLYFEFTANAVSANTQVGIGNSSRDLTAALMSAIGSIVVVAGGYDQVVTGGKVLAPNGNGGGTGTNDSAGTVFGVAVDLNNKNFWVTSDAMVSEYGAGAWNSASPGITQPNTNNTPTGYPFSFSGPYYILFSTNAPGGVTLNTAGPFKFGLPKGFSPWAGTISGSPNVGAYIAGNTICALLDETNQGIYFRINNGSWNGNASANPSSNSGPIPLTSLGAGPYFAAISGAEPGDVVTANFGASTFAQALPAGSVSWDGSQTNAGGGGTVNGTGITATVPSGIIAGNSFMVTGTLSGYTGSPPTLQYQDGTGAWNSLPTGSTTQVGLSTYQFQHPPMPVGSQTLSVRDQNNNAVTVTVPYSVGAATVASSVQQIELRLAPQYPTSPQIITDSSGNQWGINLNAQVTVNGVADTSTSQVARLVYINNQIWQQSGVAGARPWNGNPGNSIGNWSYKTSPSGSWTAGSDPRPAGLASRVANFLGTLGINTHITWVGDDNAQQTLSALQYLNIKAIRDGASSSVATYPLLAKNGIRLNCLLQNDANNEPTSAYTYDLMNQVVNDSSLGVGFLYTIESTNEVDNSASNGCNNQQCAVTNEGASLLEVSTNNQSTPGGVAGATAGGQNLHTDFNELCQDIRGNSTLKNVPIMGPSLWISGSYPTRTYINNMGDMTQTGVTFGNWHPYPNGNGGFGTQPLAVFANAISGSWNMQATYPGRPFVFTEWGYAQPENSGRYYALVGSDLAAGKMTINGFCDCWYLGNAATFFYAMRNESGDGFGYFDNSYNPYGGATIIHNFTTPLVDNGANALTFSPGVLNVTVTAPSGGQWFVTQASDGQTYNIHYWDEQEIVNQGNGSDETPGALPWSFKFGVPLAGGPTQGIYDPTNGGNYNGANPSVPNTAIGAQPAGYTVTDSTQGSVKILKVVVSLATGITITNPGTVIAGQAFQVSGSLTNEPGVPTLTYSVDGATPSPLPSGSSVLQSSFKYQNPPITTTGNHTLTIKDNNGGSASITINVTASAPTGLPTSFGLYFSPDPGTTSSGQTWTQAYNNVVEQFGFTTSAPPISFFNVYTKFDTVADMTNSPGNWVAENNSLIGPSGSIVPFIMLAMATSDGKMTHATVAAGTNDSTFQAIVNAWNGYGYKNLWFNIAPDFNTPSRTPDGTSAGSSGNYGSGVNAAGFVSAFQHVVNVIRAAASANGQTVTIVWSAGLYTAGAIDARSYYPGNQYVDVHGFHATNIAQPSSLTTWAGYSNLALGSTQQLAGGTASAAAASFPLWCMGGNAAEVAADNRNHYLHWPGATASAPNGDSLQAHGGAGAGWTGGANGASAGTSTATIASWGAMDAIMWAVYCGKPLCLPEASVYFTFGSGALSPGTYTQGSGGAPLNDMTFWPAIKALVNYAQTLGVVVGPMTPYMGTPGTNDFQTHSPDVVNTFAMTFLGVTLARSVGFFWSVSNVETDTQEVNYIKSTLGVGGVGNPITHGLYYSPLSNNKVLYPTTNPPQANLVPICGFSFAGADSNGNLTDTHAQVIAGQYDSMFENLVTEMYNGGQNVVWFRPGYEINGGTTPDGDQSGYDPAGFVNCWRRIIPLMRQRAAQLGMVALFGWNPQVIAYHTTTGDVRSYYPGNDVVDIHFLDIYNQFYPAGGYTTWPGFANLILNQNWSAVLAGGTPGSTASSFQTICTGGTDGDTGQDNSWHYYCFPSGDSYAPNADSLQQNGGASAGWTGGANGSSPGTSTNLISSWGMIDAIQWAAYCRKALAFPETGTFFNADGSKTNQLPPFPAGSTSQYINGEGGAIYNDTIFWPFFKAISKYAATLGVQMGPVTVFHVGSYWTDFADFTDLAALSASYKAAFAA